MFKELIDLYIDAIEDAHSMWMSNYCCSREEEKEREEEDDEKIRDFINTCEKIVKRFQNV